MYIMFELFQKKNVNIHKKGKNICYIERIDFLQLILLDARSIYWNKNYIPFLLNFEAPNPQNGKTDSKNSSAFMSELFLIMILQLSSKWYEAFGTSSRNM